MAVNDANARIYGDDESAVYVSAFGDSSVTLPTTLAAPGADFTDVGWLSEDGVDWDSPENVVTFNGHQGGGVIRKKITSVEHTFKFQCAEETALTMGLRYKGQAPTVTSGVAKLTVANQTRRDLRSWVFDEVDGAATKRAVVPSGEVTARATLQHRNSAITLYEFTVTAYGDWYIYSDAAGVVGS